MLLTLFSIESKLHACPLLDCANTTTFLKNCRVSTLSPLIVWWDVIWLTGRDQLLLLEKPRLPRLKQPSTVDFVEHRCLLFDKEYLSFWFYVPISSLCTKLFIAHCHMPVKHLNSRVSRCKEEEMNEYQPGIAAEYGIQNYKQSWPSEFKEVSTEVVWYHCRKCCLSCLLQVSKMVSSVTALVDLSLSWAF